MQKLLINFQIENCLVTNYLIESFIKGNPKKILNGVKYLMNYKLNI